MAKKCLLFIEDYPVIQQMYVEVLKKEGFDVTISPDGENALELAVNHHYDIVIVDMLLPKMSGMEFLEKFKKLEAQKHEKPEVIVLTDFDDPNFVEKAQQLGVKHYWMKVENTPHQLAEKIKAIATSK